jgi:hypothetical protein
VTCFRSSGTSSGANQPVSPPLFGSFEFLGREEVLARLDAAEAVLAASL